MDCASAETQENGVDPARYQRPHLAPSPPSTQPFIVTRDGHLEISTANRLAILILLVAEQDIVEIMAGNFMTSK